jgi:hypothetical protein
LVAGININVFSEVLSISNNHKNLVAEKSPPHLGRAAARLGLKHPPGGS